MILSQETLDDIFQSTLPEWGETGEEDPSSIMLEFQSTLPEWGETISEFLKEFKSGFQSTLPEWGETT